MTLVPFNDRDGFIWFDGSLQPWRSVRPHVLSHGLHYASAVFEGERAYDRTIFRLRDHTNRLLHSARVLGFDIPYSADAIDTACQAVLSANGLSDAYLRPIAWLGPEVMGVSPVGAAVHLAIAAWPWETYYGADRMRGIEVVPIHRTVWRLC